ncbi:hypothetical protein B0H66DRAFT_565567 [Apodospora peruviana]|uniref:DUF3533 domain-containing protein n=1 Tax=Apodospora peruviana TaxID=516989 RepID=A0AAE0M2H0_9PEZI|nr:hypothetical protein B0H66DRAFT_565567 [Apodospora peruviana]
MPSIKTLYPRALDPRPSRTDPARKTAVHAFTKGAITNFLLLQLLFLGLFAYVFGALYQQGSHVHNLGVVFVDYDQGGAIGRAVRAAYASLQGQNFPTLIERPPSEIPTRHDLLDEVCKTRYWAAVYVTDGASRRLQDALTADGAAATYDNTDVMGFIWNEALYASLIDGLIANNIGRLSDSARMAYTSNLTSVPHPAAPSVLAQPWALQSINIQPTEQGSRAIYNTVVIILILIQEFFYLGTINGLYAQFKLYANASPYRIVLIRLLNSLAYTMIGSLCVMATIFAFRSGWNINGNQFVLSWITFWLFAHVNFLTLDVFTIWLPHPYVPMALVTWIATNVTSVLLPFALSPAFYRVGYALPAHEVYQTLIDIWSRGCNPQLRYSLPILFAWEVVTFALSVVGVFRRCHIAILGEEMQAKEFKERVDTAVAFEMGRKRLRSRRNTIVSEEQDQPATSAIEMKRQITAEETQDGTDGGDVEEVDTVDEKAAERDAEELAEIMSRVTTRQRREQDKGHTANRDCDFGPAFELPFTRRDAAGDE